MTDAEERPTKSRWASLLSVNGVIGIIAVVLIAMFAMKFFFPPTLKFDESGPVAPLDWVVVDARTGEAIEMSSYRGEVLVLNFWATWCPPCRIEKPAINRLHQAMADEGLKVLAVSLQEDPDTVRSYIESNGYELPVAIIPNAPPGVFEIPGVPTTYIINRNGEIVARQVGMYTGWDSKGMQDRLRELLNS